MQKTKIEWCDYTINPVKGKCPMACSYCYARRMYDRFKWNPEIRYEPEVMLDLAKMLDGSKVFWGSTIELFHDSISPQFLKQIFLACKIQNNLTHIFLTKQPQNLIKWSPFPENCWVGVTATNEMEFITAIECLKDITATVHFVSIEPLLKWNSIPSIIVERLFEPRTRYTLGEYIGKYINWFIIGQQTPVSKKTEPKIEWIREIVEAADTAGIPVFLKDNLLELVNYESPKTAFAFNKDGYYRQEFP